MTNDVNQTNVSNGEPMNLNGEFTPDKKPDVIILNPSDIIAPDKQTVYEWFLSGVLDNRRKKYRDFLLSAIGKNQQMLFAADVLLTVLNSVANADDVSGLKVPSYRGYVAVCSFYVKDMDGLNPYQLSDKPDRYEVILPDGEPDTFIKMVFSKKIVLKDGLLNRLDNFTGDNSLKFAAAVLDITEPAGLIEDVRNEERAKQNIITKEIRDMIKAYTPDSLTIRAVEQTLIAGWDTMDELVKDVLLTQYVEDVHKYLKKKDIIHNSLTKCGADIKDALKVKIETAVKIRAAAYDVAALKDE